MSYNKKIIRKIRVRRIMLLVSICIAMLLITIFIENYQNKKRTIEYKQKIINLQQANINFSKNNTESDNREIKTYYVSADGVSSDGTDINNPMSLKVANQKKYYGNEKVLFKRGDIFYGTINFDVEATEEEMFYIGTYG
mgnify:CR=1 FL=1